MALGIRIKGTSPSGNPYKDKAWTYGYTGGVQTWTCPAKGLYKFTCVGADGRSIESGVGGKGGTTVYYREVPKGQILYIVCGGVGGAAFADGIGCGGNTEADLWSGYNVSSYLHISHGWWCPGYEGGGGGATHVSTASGQLNAVADNTLYCIAGGGGGAGTRWSTPYTESDVYHGIGGNYNGSFPYGGCRARSTGENQVMNGSGYLSSYSGRYGGTGYLASASTTFKGKTYSNYAQMGANAAGSNTNGSVRIDCIG